MALLMAAMMALPANAAMWVGGELGCNWIAGTDLKASFAGPAAFAPAVGVTFNGKFRDVAFQPTVIGGLSVGYDFVNAGFLGYAWPDWMKYFGFIVDFTYNRVVVRNQIRPVSGVATLGGVNVTPFLFPGGEGRLFPNRTSSNGDIPVVAFLFYGHYGFFPDSEIAVGRVHPYLGVGPAIAFTNLDLGPYGLGSVSSTNVALAAEAGIRFILLPNVTADIGFRYRYLTPSWTKTGTMMVPTALGNVPVQNATLKASVDSVNSFSVLGRVNYHF
jgi:opacity protein-like surface antigen